VRKKVVFDTSSLLAVCIYPDREPAHIFRRALLHFELVATPQTLAELAQVLGRPKFDTWRPHQVRMAWLQHYVANVVEYQPKNQVKDCRDPKDNKFLDAALAASANVIVSSDNDLLVLHPYGDIDVLNLQEFRQKYLTDQ
jgi:uncharacterized protein